MNMRDDSIRKRILKANSKVRQIQRALHNLVGELVWINSDKRGTHNRRRYKAGSVFKVYNIIAEGRDVTVWLSPTDTDEFVMSVWLHEVEFLPSKRKVNQ
jgi:hypothetical protein